MVRFGGVGWRAFLLPRHGNVVIVVLTVRVRVRVRVRRSLRV